MITGIMHNATVSTQARNCAGVLPRFRPNSKYSTLDSSASAMEVSIKTMVQPHWCLHQGQMKAVRTGNATAAQNPAWIAILAIWMRMPGSPTTVLLPSPALN